MILIFSSRNKWLNDNSKLLLILFNSIYVILLIIYVFTSFVFTSISLKDIVNPLLVLTNIILVLFIGIKSIKSDDERFLNQKRLEAYDNLAKEIPQLWRTIHKQKQYLHYFTYQVNKFKEEGKLIENSNDKINLGKEALNVIDTTYFEFLENANDILQLHTTIRFFEIRYSHLFNYNFDNKEYSNLVENSKNIYEYYLDIANKSLELEVSSKPINLDIENFLKNLVAFINGLRKEIDFSKV